MGDFKPANTLSYGALRSRLSAHFIITDYPAAKVEIFAGWGTLQKLSRDPYRRDRRRGVRERTGLDADGRTIFENVNLAKFKAAKF
jgi:hypothetical protein